MCRRALALLTSATGLCSARIVTLQNGVVTADIDTDRGLTRFYDSTTTLFVGSESWRLFLKGGIVGPGAGCELNASNSYDTGEEVAVNFTCDDRIVEVSYALRPGAAFVEKRLSLLSPGGLHFRGAELMKDVTLSLDGSVDEPEWFIRKNPFRSGLQIAAFGRFPSTGRGVFLTAANPWARHDLDGDAKGPITVLYHGDVDHDSSQQVSWFRLEPAVLGLTTLTQYSSEDVNSGEQTAFMRCVESYLLDSKMRESRTIKVHVAWDGSDYQIDVATSEGQAEYKRIFDRSAEFGVTHVVYAPMNSLHSRRSDSSDDWGWEHLLWFSMGIKMRTQEWDPRKDDVPEDILEMVRYADGKGLKLLAYVYPCLSFEALREYFVAPLWHGAEVLSIAFPEVQDYFIDVMTAFLRKTGAGGFAWDHDVFAGHEVLHYAQWQGWMRIVNTLRERFPDIVMDHRQTAHMWGPWYQLAGSYAEPIAGDENPESYGVPMANLHTDHIAADEMRRINYVYSSQALLPPARIPGFMFHQTERTDEDGKFYCSRHPWCTGTNQRDFDFLGYKYSVLSSVGTAGLNNVLAMIPARDLEEFQQVPQRDVDFIREWITWTDDHIAELTNARWIPTLSAPRYGAVDGTHAMFDDQGFIFLFNPNMNEMQVMLAIDESLGLGVGAGGVPLDAAWDVGELYPRQGAVASWVHGECVVVTLGGSDARVLKLSQRGGPPDEVRLVDASSIVFDSPPFVEKQYIKVTGASGPSGRTAHIRFRTSQDTSIAGLYMNGVKCAGESDIAHGSDIHAEVLFDGAMVTKSMRVGPGEPSPDNTGGLFETTFAIPPELADQLRDRAREYPVNWTHSATGCGKPHCVDDSKAAWLIPTRLLMYVAIANPRPEWIIRFFINGTKRPLTPAYNSRGYKGLSAFGTGNDAGVKSAFLGFYFDASDLEQGVNHTAKVELPALQPGQFLGLFWENVETEYADKVRSCSISSTEASKVPRAVPNIRESIQAKLTLQHCNRSRTTLQSTRSWPASQEAAPTWTPVFWLLALAAGAVVALVCTFLYTATCTSNLLDDSEESDKGSSSSTESSACF